MKTLSVKAASVLALSFSSLFFASAASADSCAMEYALACPIGQIDACLIPNGNATHHFCTEETSSSSGYRYIGKINIAENSSAYVNLANGTPEITGFKLAMDHKCNLLKAAVVKANPNQLIEPTRFLGTRMNGYTAEHDFSVNGGYGALVSSIAITMARRGGPIIVDICPVDVYVKF